MDCLQTHAFPYVIYKNHENEPFFFYLFFNIIFLHIINLLNKGFHIIYLRLHLARYLNYSYIISFIFFM